MGDRRLPGTISRKPRTLEGTVGSGELLDRFVKDFIRCSVDAQPRDIEPSDFMEPGGKIRVQRQDDPPIAHQIDHTGQITSIPPFA